MYAGSGKIERLTKRGPNGGIDVRNLTQALYRLASFEDLEDSGRLARLPCKIGATVYLIGEDNRIRDYEVIGVYVGKSGLKARLQRDEGVIREVTVDASLHGSDWFLNRANAEAALKERSK